MLVFVFGDVAMFLKAQVAAEFMLIFILFLAVLSIAVLASLGKTQEINRAILELEVTGLLDDVAGKIDIVFIEGHGFMMNMTIPEYISQSDYTILIDSNYVMINTTGLTRTRLLLTENVTQGGISKGLHLVKNINGEVKIT